MLTNGLHTLDEVIGLIRSNRVLLLAGDETLLSQLPPGNWIGGTSVNFVADEGGTTERERLFVTDLTPLALSTEVKRYDIDTLGRIAEDYPQNGFTIIVIPGLSDIQVQFAKNVQNYPGVFNGPLLGWLSGVHLSEVGTRTPKVFAGNATPMANEAAVLHVTLPSDKAAQVNIINLFTPSSSAAIEFETEGFVSEGDCLIDGKPANLAKFMVERGVDTRLPLVADYNGAMINVSVQEVDAAAGRVKLWAPVFRGVTYRFANPVPDYTTAFDRHVKEAGLKDVAFSCNCLLNFIHAELEGKKTGTFVGPVTFGEIAYMLLNQTLVYLTVE